MVLGREADVTRGKGLLITFVFESRNFFEYLNFAGKILTRKYYGAYPASPGGPAPLASDPSYRYARGQGGGQDTKS